MKKSIAALAAATLLTGMLLLPAGASAESEAAEPLLDENGNQVEINVYNWGEYISTGEDGSLDVNAEFTRRTGIKVNYTTFETNESLYAKLKSSGESYDVIIPSDYMIARMIEEDMLAPLDFSNIPNFDKIADRFKEDCEYDPGNQYSVPYTYGQVGILYNDEMVTETVDSWDILWDEKYEGQILMFSNCRDAFGIAQKRLGYSFNSTNMDEWNAAADSLREQKPLVQAYVMDDIFEKLEGGNAAIGVYYYGDFLTMYESNEDLAFALPREGTNRYVDAMCIPKGCENQENAEAFINFMCSTQAGLKNCEETWYSTPLLSVKDALPDEVKNDPVTYPGQEALARCEAFVNLPEDTLALYDSEWLRLKTAK